MKVLLAEDDRVVCITVCDALEEAGYQVTACADGTAALAAASHTAHDIALTDIRLPGIDGITLFRRFREMCPDMAVLLMTAYTDTDDAVAVMREGARDYIGKPFEMDELLLRLGRVRQEIALRRRMASGGALPRGHRQIRGSSPAIAKLLDRIVAAASSDVNVLITGETGTGKDLCARSIHERSRRAERPLVVVNCAAIPETLLESELFGHERGAFTGAERRRIGRFEAAAGGTLVLDEIGDMPLGSQAKLLRAIELSTFEPLGSNRPVTVDVRVIAVTNRELAAECETGRFRKDLYYRLNVIDIHTPPLRARRADIPDLVADFLAEIAERQGRPLPVIEPAALAALSLHDYPGNVRELVHALERAVALSGGGAIALDHLPDDIAATGSGAEACPDEAARAESLAEVIGRFERQYIRRTLDKVGGHRGRAAALLGISRKSLWQRLRDGPERDDSRE